ncbi:MAG: thioredoxin domain-containing protein, partial [Candidatus Sulfomarinibacteraceae bacterium]
SLFAVDPDDPPATPSGSYRTVRVKRTCENKVLTGEPSVVIDQATGLAYLGSVGELPFDQTGSSPRALRPFLEGFLPEVLQRNMNMKVRVDWELPEDASPGALIPFHLVVDTGYGEFAKPVAVTSDGRLLIMGAGMPLDGDPVAIRRALFDNSDIVVWDHGGSGEIKVEIVEFSDLECPACKGKWPMVKEAMESSGAAIRHGMVSFPLTSIHPWAFRASSATWCVGAQAAEQVIGFKELFYDLQRDMEVGLVTPTSTDFVVGNGLDEEAFKACYLRGTSLDAVHAQLALGHRVGVNATPTYFINGWMIQMPQDEWFADLISRLAKGEDP